jgi:pimeloyl-ACP methyl ester carboxylesterase
MAVFDQGRGAPLIVIPGVQGRWEWMKPPLDELGKQCRALSYTLCGDIGSDMPFDPTLGFDNFIRQLDRVFDRSGIDRAALCGVSYGGFIALRYAAVRPERVTSLVLVSSPAPGWVPNARQQQYLQRPWLSAPAFVVTSPFRLWPEIKAAYDTTRERLAFCFRHALRVIAAPIVPPLMATRVAVQQQRDFEQSQGSGGDPAGIDQLVDHPGLLSRMTDDRFRRPPRRLVVLRVSAHVLRPPENRVERSSHFVGDLREILVGDGLPITEHVRLRTPFHPRTAFARDATRARPSG